MQATEKTVTRTVLVNGCFDPTHVGHVLHLQAARELGTRLVVALTSDEQVKREKGPKRPMFKQDLRELMLRALRCVDDIVVVDSALEGLMLVKPDVFVKGIDYKHGISPEDQAYCDENAIEVCITETPKWSATEIGNALRAG